jgi:hypothetical protein
VRRAAVLKQGTNSLGQVVEIQFLGPERALDLRRPKRGGSRSLEATQQLGFIVV